MAYFLYWLLFANIFSFLQMGHHKQLARMDRRRIPEASMLGWMAVGGVVGGLLAARFFRHKTRKQPFASQMLAILIGWLVVLALHVSGYLDPLVKHTLAVFASAF